MPRLRIYMKMDKVRTITDGELVRRCASGDDAALAELFALYGAQAHRVAWRALRDPDLAQDAVQEAFLQLWRTAAAFDPTRAALGTWICVLAHRRAVDIARREARRRLADEQPASPLDRGSYTAEELVLLRYDRRRVQVAVEELSVNQRQVVELAFWGGLTHTQLAARLGIPIGTVKSRMFDALRRLDTLLAPAT